VISPEAAVAACTRATEHHASGGTEWPDAIHHTIRSLLDRLAAAKGLPPTGLKYPANAAAETALDTMGRLEGWHVLDIGEIHQRLLELTPSRREDGCVTAHRKSLGKRADLGAWYTPPEIAEAMCRLSIGPHLDRLAQDSHPGAMFDVLAIDPACGAGVFLVEAARLIAGRIAARVSGAGPAPRNHVRAALPVVMKECVFGVDIDPVAVDMAKTALWLEIEGRAPFTFMDRNIVVGDALQLDQPPAYTERCGDPATAEDRRNFCLTVPAA
jgi:hypothetical protein